MPTERHEGPRLQVTVAPSGSQAARSLVFEPANCTRIDTHIDETSNDGSRSMPVAHGHVEIECRTAAGDGISGSVDFAGCRH
jgi:hypothetical protein